ncbi:glycosyltransferase [Pseudoalteromonas pernae]|uniref:glycosyltransferase n=1 Tax=Pseudoalteromonas pernae TaxID=3118054 RepID=UPI003242F9B9
MSYSVGVYIPTKNRLELLKKALSSVLAQTYNNIRVCIVDDGSTDGTSEYLNGLNDPRITVIRNEQSIGACAARNKAIAALDTDLVTGLDDDDVFLVNRIEELVSQYDDKYSFVCSGYIWDYGAHKKPLFNTDKVITLSDALDLNQCSNQALVRRERVLAVGGFDPELPALQDHDLWVRLIAEFGSAFRLGKELYVVNDDQELLRISSINNKLRAIELFEKKHGHAMSQRNKENFAFYRKKITGDRVSWFEAISSSKHGLATLKIRHALAQSFDSLARARLDYIHGNKSDSRFLNWVLHSLVPLLATGGPGASRVLLLSSCLFFLGSTNTADFSSDFFILMILNTLFSQSFGFFLLKPDYHRAFYGVQRQSLKGLACGVASVALLYQLGVIANFALSLAILMVLHFYYLYRYKRISCKGFFLLAISECVISLLCLVTPILYMSLPVASQTAPYWIYLISLSCGLAVLALFDEAPHKNSQFIPIPAKKVSLIATSTVASVFALFSFPYLGKTLFAPEVASYIALTISCFSIAMLIPRTQANKSFQALASASLEYDELAKINRSYRQLIYISFFTSFVLTFGYLMLFNVPFEVAIAIPAGVMMIMFFSQMGFIDLTTLSLRDNEAVVAKLNTLVLVAVALALIMSSLLFKGSVLVATLGFFSVLLVYLFRNLKASVKIKKLLSLELE